jgi:hypothetical protein
MTKYLLVLSVVAALAASVSGADDQERPKQALDLAPPVRVLAGDQPLEVEGYAAPWCGDFDGDGTKDLLVGQFVLGRMRIYRNIGSNAHPQFNTFEWFTAGGQPACVPNCCLVAFTPQLLDFDGDGRTDVLTGSGWSGGVFLYRREADGTFAAAEVLEDKHGQTQMARLTNGRATRPYNVTAFAVDWDADGDLDLLLGRAPLCLVLNEGTATAPSFGETRLLECDGKPILEGLGSPQMADWDGDGLDDLIAGLKSNIVWYRNIGTRANPQFASPQLLVARTVDYPVDAVPDKYPGAFHAFCVTDFNADGRLDLLVGDRFRRTTEADDQRQPQSEESTKRLAALQEEYDRLLNAPTRDESRADRVERYRRLLRNWEEQQLMRPSSGAEQRGFVWYYERGEKK